MEWRKIYTVFFFFLQYYEGKMVTGRLRTGRVKRAARRLCSKCGGSFPSSL